MLRVCCIAMLSVVAACARGGVPELTFDASTPVDGFDAGDPGGMSPCQALDPALCDPASAASIYVSTSGDDGRNGQTPAQAVRSLAVAIDLATACTGAPCNVRIAQGTYEGSFALRDGVHLFGGFAADFRSRDVAAHPVIVTSADNRTVIAEGLRALTLVDGLTVQGAMLATGDGRSSHAVWVHDAASQLTLMRSTLVAGRGADGAAGAAGALTACTPQAGLGGESSDCASTSGSGGGAGVDPQTGGAGGEGGSNNCPSACPLVGRDGISDGASGTPGEAGTDGERGVAATEARGSWAGGDWKAPTGSPGGRGKHGTGGGGGGSGGTKRIRACFSCDTLLGGRGGNGGAGGCGGGGGTQGGAGGGAFALTVMGSTVILENVVLRGGQGGAGATGGAGAEGSAGSEADDSLRSDGATARCGLLDYGAGNGGSGAPGGHGGYGGGGAGGIGGAAVTLVLVGEAKVERVGDVTVQPGEAGPGGAGGASGGARGEAGKPGYAAPEASF